MTGITRKARRGYILLATFLCGTSVLVGGRKQGAPGDLLWQAATGGVVAASNGRVVVGGSAGVQTFDGVSGTLLWQDNLADVSTVVINSLQVIAVGPNTIRAYDASNGLLYWQSALPSGTSIGAAQIQGNQLLTLGFVVDATGESNLLFRSYNIWTGQVDFEDQSLPANARLSNVGRKSLSIHGSRAFAAVTVTVPDQNSNFVVSCLVRAYDRIGGALLWESITDERCRANAVAAQGRQIIVAGVGGSGVDDFMVKTYDAATGQLLWQDRTFVSTGFDNQAVAVDNEGQRAFVAGWVRWVPGMFNQEAFLVRAYNLKTGALEWEDQYPGPMRVCLCHAHDIVVQDGRVFAVGGGFGTSPAVFIARAYEAGNGNLVWDSALPSESGTVESVAVDGGIVFAADRFVLRAFVAK